MPATRGPKSRSLADLARVEAALGRALREALGLHMRLGHAVPEWKDGRVVWLDPSKLLNGDARKGFAKRRATKKKGSRARSRGGASRSTA